MVSRMACCKLPGVSGAERSIEMTFHLVYSMFYTLIYAYTCFETMSFRKLNKVISSLPLTVYLKKP